MNQNKWITLVKTSKPYQLNLIKGKLLEKEINSVIINKIDSSLPKLWRSGTKSFRI